MHHDRIVGYVSDIILKLVTNSSFFLSNIVKLNFICNNFHTRGYSSDKDSHNQKDGKKDKLSI